MSQGSQATCIICVQNAKGLALSTKRPNEAAAERPQRGSGSCRRAVATQYGGVAWRLSTGPAMNSRRCICDLPRGCRGTGYVEGTDFKLRTLNAFTGRLKPLRLNSSVNSASASVSTALKTLPSIRICPFFA